MKLIFSLVFICCLLVGCKENAPNVSAIGDAPNVSAIGDASNTAKMQSDNNALVNAYKNKKSDIFVEGTGVVKKILPDDNKGSRHQKFLVSISPEQTLLFAHNIDLAPRVENLQIGDAMTFKGEYVYNPKGGVMHWTHKDPNGGTKAGWIKHNGKTYE